MLYDAAIIAGIKDGQQQFPFAVHMIRKVDNASSRTNVTETIDGFPREQGSVNTYIRVYGKLFLEYDEVFPKPTLALCALLKMHALETKSALKLTPGGVLSCGVLRCVVPELRTAPSSLFLFFFGKE